MLYSFRFHQFRHVLFIFFPVPDMKNVILLLALSLLLSSCYRMRTSHGGGQIASPNSRKINPSDIAITGDYKIEVVAKDLTFPSAITFDNNGNIYVVETGYVYGEIWKEPKLLKISGGKKVEEIVKGPRNGPWTGVQFYNGNFYISEGGEAEGGRILQVSPQGDIKVLVDNLPSVGDHHTDDLVIKDNYIYFGQGSATNSGIVGTDNASFGWLKRKPDFHDIPCGDMELIGKNYRSENVLTEAEGDEVETGAFSPFGTPTTKGQIIKGKVPCTGAILRVPIEGGKVEMVAWGLRNPYGIALSPDGKLFTTENSYDERGSRPVWGTADVLWEVKQGTWYGWPDFSAGKRIQYDEEFKSPSDKAVEPLLINTPSTPSKPTAEFGVHSSSSGIAFSTSDSFGFKGEAFVAQFGDMAPNVGKVLEPVGFKIVRVDVATGVVRDFAVNKGKRNGPASWLKSGGLERPVSVRFDQSGRSLYVVDFGILTMKEGPHAQEGTGVIWKITKK
jgi:glucose/arabinose dehydrogenase